MPTKSKPKVVGVSHEEVMREELKDPEFRFHYVQRKLARGVALAVREMRTQAKLSQRQLAKKIGVAQPMIARVESGNDPRTPGLDVLNRVGQALGKQLIIGFVSPKHGKPAPIIGVDAGSGPRERFTLCRV